MAPKTKFVLNAFISYSFFSILLFVAAGTLNYFQGWLYVSVNFIATVMNILTIQSNPELMTERTRPGTGIKSWDKRILGFSFLIFVLTLLLAGLDSGRYGWSPEWNWSIYALGVCALISGQIIFLLARSENKYFSTVMRIQKERGHTVCDSGLYRVVRHPGYLGMIVSTIGLPCILGSLWSAIPTFFAIILLCMRTSFEDKTLADELEGYTAYAEKTPYKLIPLIW